MKLLTELWRPYNIRKCNLHPSQLVAIGNKTQHWLQHHSNDYSLHNTREVPLWSPPRQVLRAGGFGDDQHPFLQHVRPLVHGIPISWLHHPEVVPTNNQVELLPKYFFWFSSLLLSLSMISAPGDRFPSLRVKIFFAHNFLIEAWFDKANGHTNFNGHCGTLTDSAWWLGYLLIIVNGYMKVPWWAWSSQSLQCHIASNSGKATCSFFY